MWVSGSNTGHTYVLSQSNFVPGQFLHYKMASELTALRNSVKCFISTVSENNHWYKIQVPKMSVFIVEYHHHTYLLT